MFDVMFWSKVFEPMCFHLPKLEKIGEVSYKPIWEGTCKYCDKEIKCNEIGIWYAK